MCPSTTIPSLWSRQRKSSGQVRYHSTGGIFMRFCEFVDDQQKKLMMIFYEWSWWMGPGLINGQFCRWHLWHLTWAFHADLPHHGPDETREAGYPLCTCSAAWQGDQHLQQDVDIHLLSGQVPGGPASDDHVRLWEGCDGYLCTLEMYVYT